MKKSTENIIEIKSADYRACINLSRGANCIELKYSRYGADILRTPDYSKELDNPFLYGMPMLYPANRIYEGKFTFEGREYKFPVNEKNTNCHLHGSLHNAPFTLLKQGEGFVSCMYESGEEPWAFPHKFRVVVTYSLSEGGLLQEIEIINQSEKNMPNLLGFHTTFNLPFLKNSSVENVRVLAQVGEEIERSMDNYLPTGRILAEDETTRQLKEGVFNPGAGSLSRHYRGGGAIELIDTQKKIKVVYKCDEKFKFRLFYKEAFGDYVCLEPMTCMANCPKAPFDGAFAGFDFILPQSSKKYISKIYVEEM
ncbi:MAG: aldose 1-epimerase [Clostridia bacterium]|nr:aldose 1-epimerase [Clostridia bacterium]